MYPIKAPKYIKQMLTDFHQFHPKKKKKMKGGTLSNSFFESSITLI